MRESSELGGAQFPLLKTRATNQASAQLADLAAAQAEFEQTLEATRAGRREHVGPSADLRAVATETAQQARWLDGLVRYRTRRGGWRVTCHAFCCAAFALRRL